MVRSLGDPLPRVALFARRDLSVREEQAFADGPPNVGEDMPFKSGKRQNDIGDMNVHLVNSAQNGNDPRPLSGWKTVLLWY